MTNIFLGSSNYFFKNKEIIADYILNNILNNKNHKIGSEWEAFLVCPNGKAITCKNGQLLFRELHKTFSSKKMSASFIYETSRSGETTISGLTIDSLGTITPEMGHQIEFSSIPCNSSYELLEKNKIFYECLFDAAKRIDHTPIFKGHLPKYALSSEGSYRSRSKNWQKYFHNRFHNNANYIGASLYATASIQVSLDSGGSRFHEFFQALLLVEPALNLYYSNSDRLGIIYSRFPQAHTAPIIDIWGTRTPRAAVEALVDRLMLLDVPFLPDPAWPNLYKEESLNNLCPPTVKNLMQDKRLNENLLNNSGGFFLARPALRNFSLALIELRGTDSQSTPEKATEVARRLERLVYDDMVREKLLEDYAYLTKEDIYQLQKLSILEDKQLALNSIVAGTKVRDIVDDILDRSQTDCISIYIPPVLKQFRVAA